MSGGIEAYWTAPIACCRPVAAGLPATLGGRCTEAAESSFSLSSFPAAEGRPFLAGALPGSCVPARLAALFVAGSVGVS